MQIGCGFGIGITYEIGIESGAKSGAKSGAIWYQFTSVWSAKFVREKAKMRAERSTKTPKKRVRKPIKSCHFERHRDQKKPKNRHKIAKKQTPLPKKKFVFGSKADAK